ncbi:MAG: ABC transporter ATP-binding protein [Thermoleophilia bacterium]
MAEIELIGVEKRYGDVVVCSDVNLHIGDGEFLTLLGPSGCGKTTTLNMTAGLDEVTAGEIRMNGQVVNDLTPFERDVAMVFQNYALYPHMTVADNIGFTLKLRKFKKDEIKRRVDDVAEVLELSHVLDRLPRELSGGQQQRVALGRAVIRQPQVFLFDEPFSNLDAALRMRMRVEVKAMHQRLGITSIFVTHDQEEALSLSDRIAIMNGGKIEQIGTPEDVYSRPCSTYVARFIGSPQMDIMVGSIEDRGGRATYSVGSTSFEIPAGAAPSTHGAVDLGVRSEHIRIGQGGTPLKVIVVQPLGSETYVTLGDADLTFNLTARVPGMARYTPGDLLDVSFDPEGLLFFDRESGRRIEADGALA